MACSARSSLARIFSPPLDLVNISASGGASVVLRQLRGIDERVELQTVLRYGTQRFSPVTRSMSTASSDVPAAILDSTSATVRAR